MDEPLGALDKKLRKDMQLEIKRLHRELGITMLYVTHEQEEALVMSDRIVLLTVGQVAQMGTPDELYHRPLSTFVANFLGQSNLLEGHIEDQGPPVCVRTADGLALLSQPLLSEPPTAMRVGEPVSVMVRPENVMIAMASDAEVEMENTVVGTVNESVTLGGVVRHYVTGPEGRVFVAVEFNRPGLRVLAKGTPVRLAWRAVDMRVPVSRGGEATLRA
jgi:putative spermidine/putrescine transport system ATP-binding protein